MMCARRSSPPERGRRTDPQKGGEKHKAGREAQNGTKNTKRGAVVPLGLARPGPCRCSSHPTQRWDMFPFLQVKCLKAFCF